MSKRLKCFQHLTEEQYKNYQDEAYANHTYYKRLIEGLKEENARNHEAIEKKYGILHEELPTNNYKLKVDFMDY